MEISYPYICSSQSEIPKEALEHLGKEIVEKLGSSFRDIFPQFAQIFRLTSEAIEKNWSTPKVVLKKGIRKNIWLSFIVVQTNNKNLFFDLQPEFMEKKGELFNEGYEMLPESWKELYRWFNSFVVAEESYCPMDWWNTPFSYESRINLDDYEEGSGVTRQQTVKLAKAIGCKRDSLRCWLLTENEDALFINEEACDGKVYHVRGKQLDVITEILDPRKTLDEYLAHYLSGGKPADFQFS